MGKRKVQFTLRGDAFLGYKSPFASMKRSLPVLRSCGRRMQRARARTAPRHSLALGNTHGGGPCPCHPPRIRHPIGNAPAS